MIRICLKSSNLFKPARLLSGSSAKFSNDVSDRSHHGPPHDASPDPIKLTDKILNDSKQFQKIVRCNQPVEGEPVPPAKNPYINGKDPSLKAFRPTGIDESKTSFFMFPGQGSQYVGMGKSLLESGSNRQVVQSMFRTASNILGYDLEELCLNGPEDKLNQTLYAQPAIFVTSLAGKLAIRSHPRTN